MTETGFIGGCAKPWPAARPAPGPTLRQSVIQFSANLPAIIGAPMDDIRPGPQLPQADRPLRRRGLGLCCSLEGRRSRPPRFRFKARNGPSEDEDSEVLEDGPLHDLLNRRNLYQSPFDFIEQYQDLDGAGRRAFILLDRGPSGKPATTAIYILPLFDEQTMTVIRGKTIRPDGPIDGYIYQVQGIERDLPARRDHPCPISESIQSIPWPRAAQKLRPFR